MNLTQKSINYIGAISSEIVKEAGSGHTGIALGASTILFALFKDHYKFDTKAKNINRDRFVLSAGHASALYYTLLYTFGFDVTIDDLESFRNIGSKTPGHPEYKSIDGVEVSTGPLGQGVANAVGFSIASAHLGKLFNVQKFKIFDGKTYCFVGDGDLMEGVAQEALSVAGNLQLKNLIVLYDYNNNTIDGNLTKANSENIRQKYESMGFRVIYVRNGNDYKSVTKAISKAKRKQTKPTLIIFKTKIGFQSIREDDHTIHGAPLSDDEFESLKEKLGITTSMFIPNSVLKYCRQSKTRNIEKFDEWKSNLFIYEQTHPDLYKKLSTFDQEVKISKDKLLKLFNGTQNISGRAANSKILNEIACKIPNIIGGSADLFASTKTYIENGKDMSSDQMDARNIFFGIREHAMAAICNGISLYSNTRSFNSTFLSFSQYMLPSIRLSAMMQVPVWYYFTHDSIYIGQDGPTHQPIEQLGQLRLTPNLNVFRPADHVELVELYDYALSNKQPICFVLSRQNLPVVANSKICKAKNGAYVVSGAKTNDVQITFMAAGSEVSLAIEAQNTLEKQGISSKVISVPSTTLFEKQTNKYKQTLLKNAGVIVAVEASNDNYWYKYTQNVYNLSDFGMSGTPNDVAKKYGFTSKKLANYCKKLLK